MSTLQDQINKVNPKHLFLFDSLGALVSAVLLGLVLANFESTFGMPQATVYMLAIIPIPFFFYSLFCFLLYPENWRPYLRLIAIANILYCLLTLSLMFIKHSELTFLGFGYFIGEIIIVVSLAVFELRVAAR